MKWTRYAIPTLPATLALLATSVGGVAQITGAVTFQGPVPPANLVPMAWFDSRVVKGAPYSAEAITETTQVLNDGNRITGKSVAHVYRDSEGRTRREQTVLPLSGPVATGDALTTVFINDPVAGASYILDPRSKTAHKTPVPFLKGVPSQAIERFERPLEQNRQKLAPSPSKAGAPGLHFKQTEHSQTKTESLGTQIIEGIEAEDTRSTTTIPAGEIGNERPIEIVSEQWYSPQLQTLVLTKGSDPRFGETVYRLTNIRQEEPEPSLFQVPPDYTVEELQPHRPSFFNKHDDAEQEQPLNRPPEKLGKK